MDSSDNSNAKSLHDRKIAKLQHELEEKKDYVCVRNFPIKLDGRKRIDLVCFQGGGGKIVGVEVDSNTENEQTELNVKKLKKLKELFSTKKVVELCEFDLLKGGCIRRKKPRGEVDGE